MRFELFAEDEVTFLLSWLLLAGLLACATLLGIALVFVWATAKLPAVSKGTVAFFHPFADGGGGGERVLWCAVRAVQEAAPEFQVVIYVRQGVAPKQLLEDAAKRFNIHIAHPVQVVPLTNTHLIQPERYKRFTLAGQALGSIRLAHEGLAQLVPEVFIDTTGWAFAYPLAWKAGSKVACYVHYPTISTDMLDRVWSGLSTYNNDSDIAESPIKTLVKVLYYRVVALAYGLCGFFSTVTMVNSSWTRNHILSLWWHSQDPLLVYPPVDTSDLQQLPLKRKLKHLYLVSVNQFRPEKNHRLQLEAYALARRQAGQDTAGYTVRISKLQMIGGCRNDDDQARIDELKRHAEELEISDNVEWLVNAPYSELKYMLGEAVGGLHTMIDEHFGISVVEYMAAGVIPIANRSGGPKEDIVVPLLTDEGEQITGFLASTVEEYAEAITRVLVMDQQERLKIATAAQQQAMQFSVERFHMSFQQAILPLLQQNQQIDAL